MSSNESRASSASTLAARLPDIRTVNRWSRSLATLDAILSPEWEFRYFSYDPAWGEGECLASMRNGSGDDYSITFNAAGAYLRGFDHESPLSPFARTPPSPWPGLLDRVPEVLAPAAKEPAFTLDDVPLVTVALWRLEADSIWQYGRAQYPPEWDEAYDDIDGACWLFEQLDGDPATYTTFAGEYFERDVPLDVVAAVHGGESLTPEMVTALNPGAVVNEVLDEVRAIGYPVTD